MVSDAKFTNFNIQHVNFHTQMMIQYTSKKVSLTKFALIISVMLNHSRATILGMALEISHAIGF